MASEQIAWNWFSVIPNYLSRHIRPSFGQMNAYNARTKSVFSLLSVEWIRAFRSVYAFFCQMHSSCNWAVSVYQRLWMAMIMIYPAITYAANSYGLNVSSSTVRLLRTKTRITRNPKMNKSFLLLILVRSLVGGSRRCDAKRKHMIFGWSSSVRLAKRKIKWMGSRRHMMSFRWIYGCEWSSLAVCITQRITISHTTFFSGSPSPYICLGIVE